MLSQSEIIRAIHNIGYEEIEFTEEVDGTVSVKIGDDLFNIKDPSSKEEVVDIILKHIL